MAKSAWKFSITNRKEMRMYSKEFKLLREKQGLQYYGFEKNNLRLNNLNWMNNYLFYLGNAYTEKSFYLFCTTMIAKRFLKFKKPFNFKPKKKKK